MLFVHPQTAKQEDLPLSAVRYCLFGIYIWRICHIVVTGGPRCCVHASEINVPHFCSAQSCFPLCNSKIDATSPVGVCVCVCVVHFSLESNWCHLFSQASSVGAPYLPLAHRTVFKHNSSSKSHGPRGIQDIVPCIAATWLRGVWATISTCECIQNWTQRKL